MKRALRVVSWMLAFVALGSVAAAWVLLGASPPELEGDAAAEVAVGALAHVGYEGSVEGEPQLGVHEPDEGEPVDAWMVRVDVDGDVVELRVQESRGQVVYVDDRIGPENTERLLTDDEFERIGSYRDDTVVAERLRLNIAATVSALAIAALGFLIAKRSGRLLETP